MSACKHGKLWHERCRECEVEQGQDPALRDFKDSLTPRPEEPPMDHPEMHDRKLLTALKESYGILSEHLNPQPRKEGEEPWPHVQQPIPAIADVTDAASEASYREASEPPAGGETVDRYYSSGLGSTSPSPNGALVYFHDYQKEKERGDRFRQALWVITKCRNFAQRTQAIYEGKKLLEELP